MAKNAQSGKMGFLFRGLPKNILIGTASDCYAGWIGQIYTPGRYENGITRRSHKAGDKTFTEETLPVESVGEYFEHFLSSKSITPFTAPSWNPREALPQIIMSLKATASR